MASIHYLRKDPAMHTNDWPARRPYIHAGCDQQGRVEAGQRAPAPAECSTDIGADMPGVRGPLPNSVGRWARVLIGFVVCVFAAIGAGAFVGFLTR